jgi:hypothetical protein
MKPVIDAEMIVDRGNEMTGEDPQAFAAIATLERTGLGDDNVCSGRSKKICRRPT